MPRTPASYGLPGWLASLVPSVRAMLQHVAIAGTLSGVLGAAFHAWLAGHAPDHAVASTHQVIPLAAAFHGRHLAEYFVTPVQFAVWRALLLPAAVSLLVLMGALVWLGVRTARGSGLAGRDGSGRADVRWPVRRDVG